MISEQGITSTIGRFIFPDSPLDAVRNAAKSHGPLSKKAGDKGDNGVAVKFGTTGDKNGGNTTLTHDKTGVIVTMNSRLVVNGAKGDSNYIANITAVGLVAHEGSHVEDFMADIANNFDAAHDIIMRHNAYGVENVVLTGAGYQLMPGHDWSTPAGIDNELLDSYGTRNLDVPFREALRRVVILGWP